MDDEVYYSLRELAEKYKTSVDFWRKNIKRNKISKTKVGSLVRIKESEVEKIVRDIPNRK